MITFLALTVLVWDAPTTRTDGTALPLSEIDHYEMQVNGTFYDTASASSSTMDIGSATGTFRIRCCDVYADCSEWSNELVISAGGRGKPNAPGQLRKQQ